jgi:hypothetical protein
MPYGGRVDFQDWVSLEELKVMKLPWKEGS